MKGTIEPDKNLFAKFNKIGDAPRLSIEMGSEKETKTLVVANILSALIMSGQKFSGDDAMIKRAISLGDKLIKAIDKNTEES